MPLTPDDVQDVRFDHAPLGKRGYHEDQVDDFLDQVELALRGGMKMTAQDVKEIEFDQGGIVRRGYDEKQVDEFLEAIVIQLEGGDPGYVVRRAQHVHGHHNGAVVNGNGHGTVVGTLHQPAPPNVNGHTNGHPNGYPNGHAVPRPAEPMTQPVPVQRVEPRPRPVPPPMPMPQPDPNSVPLPPAVPGMHGYRERDVQRMAECVRAAMRSPHGPTAEDIARMRLERVGDGEKGGYDPFLVEALRDAWVAELRRRGR